jgi:hypothetical protein
MGDVISNHELLSSLFKEARAMSVENHREQQIAIALNAHKAVVDDIWNRINSQLGSSFTISQDLTVSASTQ